MNAAPIGPADALALLELLPGRQSLAALRRALVARGTPVSLTSLRKWSKSGWQCKRAAKPLQAALLREARNAAREAGLPADVVRALEAKLEAMTDGELVISVTRRLLFGAGLLLELARVMAPELMRSDPRGLAALCMAASRMTERAHASMTEARNLAERAMKARCTLMLPGPQDADRYAQRDGDRDGDRNAERALSDRPPFADLIARFGAVPQ